jgi:DNA-binding GntR family transcriptional regulator
VNQPARQLKRRSLSEEVAETLRDMILVGELRPEQRVTQDELAATLGVSTMPVREGLLKLAHEGLVEASPNRSFRIVRNTREDISDIYWMHAVLAGELTARACRRQDLDPGLIERMQAQEDALAEATAARNTVAMEAANWSFHRQINRAAGAPRLLLMLRSTLRHIPHHFYTLIEDWAPVSRSGHEAIIQAFESRDPDAARSAATKHVEEAGRLVIAHFTDTGYWKPPGEE